MYILSTLDKPSSGSIAIDGRDVASWNSRELHHFRNTQVGFIFQFHYLLPELTALENILLAPMNLGLAKQKTSQAMELMDLVGVSDQARKLPGQMSGGQQQRVAIARALIMNPRYIFADEPTGNLDTHNSEIIMKVLLDTRDRHKTTVILVTHDPDYARLADREIYLVDGHIAPTK
jgi:putative ABC transport system ATP-binding protein/lipoprotein-releasing system ATP-binding protein